MDNYKRIQERLLKLNLGLAVLGFVIPAILWLIEGERYRSISAYAHSPHPYILPTLLTLSAFAYINDGIAHRLKWWQFVIGGSLIGIALTPVDNYTYYHYTFTAIYFIGNSAIMIWQSNKKNKTKNIIYAAIMSMAIIASFILKLFPVFFGEWIGFVPAIIYYKNKAMESYSKISI